MEKKNMIPCKLSQLTVWIIMSIASHWIIAKANQRMKRIDQMVDLVGANEHLKVLFEPFGILLVKTVQDQFDFTSQLVVLK